MGMSGGSCEGRLRRWGDVWGSGDSLTRTPSPSHFAHTRTLLSFHTHARTFHIHARTHSLTHTHSHTLPSHFTHTHTPLSFHTRTHSLSFPTHTHSHAHSLSFPTHARLHNSATFSKPRLVSGKPDGEQHDPPEDAWGCLEEVVGSYEGRQRTTREASGDLRVHGRTLQKSRGELRAGTGGVWRESVYGRREKVTSV